MGEKPLSHRQKSSLKFVEQDDPPFIKQMKTKMGYREPATISDKVFTIFLKIIIRFITKKI